MSDDIKASDYDALAAELAAYKAEQHQNQLDLIEQRDALAARVQALEAALRGIATNTLKQGSIDERRNEGDDVDLLIKMYRAACERAETAERDRDSIRREEWAKARGHFKFTHRQVMAQLQASTEHGAVLVNRIAQLELILLGIYPAAREILWCALVWNDHNFDETALLRRANNVAKSLGFERLKGDPIEAANKWMEHIDAVLAPAEKTKEGT